MLEIEGGSTWKYLITTVSAIPLARYGACSPSGNPMSLFDMTVVLSPLILGGFLGPGFSPSGYF